MKMGIEDMRAKGDVEGLIKALKDKSWDVRRDAVRALGGIKDARALEPLIKALKDKNSDVRDAAEEALEKIKAKES